MTPAKIKIYLDIDGVLLTTKHIKPADHSTQFVDFIINNFDCYWLSTHCKGEKDRVLKYLSQYFDMTIIEKLNLIKPTNWCTLKTEAIDFASTFFWIEDYPFISEVNILNENNCRENLIIANLNNKDELNRIINQLKSEID